MRGFLLGSAALSIAALISGASSAEGGQGTPQGRHRVDVSRLGPQVGERVPDFSLPDQTGGIRNLESIMGSRGAMIVFYRSADW